MEIVEIGTGYTAIPALMGAATEIVVEALTRGFRNSGRKVTLVDIGDKNRQPTDLPIREVKIPPCFSGTDVSLGLLHKGKRVVYSIALTKTLKGILKEAKEPVLLHFHNQYNLFFFLLLTRKSLRRKAKIAYTVHSYIWPKPWEKIRGTVWKRYFQEIFCVRKADYVLVLNDKTAEQFVTHLGVQKERIHKVKNGVDHKVYRPLSDQENEEFKEKTGLAGKEFVLQVGSICDRKNQLGAVKQLTKFLQSHPDFAYVFAGGILDRGYFEELKEYAKENGIAHQVIYAGEVPPGADLNRYYSAANAMVFPSKLESFGMVILEALAAGTTVLLTEKPLFPLSCGCQDFRGIVPGKQVEEKAREEVAARYGWEAVAREHLAIFAAEGETA